MDAHTRLLDLLAGWNDYAVGPEEYPSAIFGAYQNAGQRDDMTEDAIKSFVSEYIIPILLKGRL